MIAWYSRDRSSLSNSINRSRVTVGSAIGRLRGWEARVDGRAGPRADHARGARPPGMQITRPRPARQMHEDFPEPGRGSTPGRHFPEDEPWHANTGKRP